MPLEYVNDMTQCVINKMRIVQKYFRTLSRISPGFKKRTAKKYLKVRFHMEILYTKEHNAPATDPPLNHFPHFIYIRLAKSHFPSLSYEFVFVSHKLIWPCYSSLSNKNILLHYMNMNSFINLLDERCWVCCLRYLRLLLFCLLFYNL